MAIQYFYVAACPVDHREELELLDDYLSSGRGALRYEPTLEAERSSGLPLPFAKASRWWLENDWSVLTTVNAH
ncbi:hypothetical protein QA635_07900 [Bradyrhizobium brasilense]|uniref:hypothetical protein n=1 Tax=Bradyrhizobium brasilense TaxID=1419277 RepID=UPI0024B0FED9|nr:hypothetical protein [Bradyrhizobium australafricanum]WFU34340.1 hypothetical protein QA635_07900 [Bradyrhizobium australafricanum]